MEMNFKKVVMLKDVPEVQQIEQLLKPLYSSYIEDQWVFFRRQLLSECLPAYQEEARRELEKIKPGISKLVGESVQEDRTLRHLYTNVLIEDELKSHGFKTKLRDFLYLNYSSDIKGRGRGITQTTFESVFGSVSDGCVVRFQVECRYCRTMGEGMTNTLSQDLYRNDVEIKITCGMCGHVEKFASLEDSAQPDVLLCECPSCRIATIDTAKAVKEHMYSFGNALAKRIVSEMESTFHRLLNKPGGKPVSKSCLVVAKHLLAQKNCTLLAAIEEWIGPISYSDFYSYLTRVWNVLEDLHKAGLVEVRVATSDLEDSQRVLEMVFCSEVQLIRRHEDQAVMRKARAAKHVTTLLTGPDPHKRGSLLDWVNAVEELGLLQNWFELPVDFKWVVVEGRVRELASTT